MGRCPRQKRVSQSSSPHQSTPSDGWKKCHSPAPGLGGQLINGGDRRTDLGGEPGCITSHRGPQFTCAVCAVLCHKLGMVRKQTTACPPLSNGMVERVHHQVEHGSVELSGWSTSHGAFLGLRIAPKEDSLISSPVLVFECKSSRIPGPHLWPVKKCKHSHRPR